MMISRKPMITWVEIIAVLLFFCSQALAEEIVIDDFHNGLASGWQEKKFVKQTTYRLTEEDGRKCIKAVSEASASGLFYKIKFDPQKFPYISWSWKIEHTVANGDAHRREGDDYAARIYIVFPSLFFWNTRAINYIWANKLPKGEMVASPYTSRDALIAVESGNELAGRWIEERRNVYEDFQEFFGEAPPTAGAVAIMTDTDNTGGATSACYGPIRLLSGKTTFHKKNTD
jgi:hypothetical protein